MWEINDEIILYSPMRIDKRRRSAGSDVPKETATA